MGPVLLQEHLRGKRKYSPRCQSQRAPCGDCSDLGSVCVFGRGRVGCGPYLKGRSINNQQILPQPSLARGCGGHCPKGPYTNTHGLNPSPHITQSAICPFGRSSDRRKTRRKQQERGGASSKVTGELGTDLEVGQLPGRIRALQLPLKRQVGLG